MPFGRNVYYAHIAVGTVSCRRCGYNLYLVDIRCGDLLQSLRTLKHALLAVDVDQKSRTAAERHLTVGIYTHRGRRTQHIHRRTSRRRQRRRGVHRLTVETVDDLAALALNNNALQTVLLHRQTHLAQIDRTPRGKFQLAALVWNISHKHNSDEEASVAHMIDLECAVTHRRGGYGSVFGIRNHHIGILYGRTRSGIRHAAAQRGLAALRRRRHNLHKQEKGKKITYHRTKKERRPTVAAPFGCKDTKNSRYCLVREQQSPFSYLYFTHKNALWPHKNTFAAIYRRRSERNNAFRSSDMRKLSTAFWMALLCTSRSRRPLFSTPTALSHCLTSATLTYHATAIRT